MRPTTTMALPALLLAAPAYAQEAAPQTLQVEREVQELPSAGFSTAFLFGIALLLLAFFAISMMTRGRPAR